MLGNANFAADEPFDLHAEFKRPASAGGRWNVHCERQQDFVAVTKVNQLFARLQTLGAGPLHFSGSEFGRQLPFKGRWLAGIAGIDPVNVPALFQNEMYSQSQVRSGFY
jgi:hypothetical protein